MGPSVRRWCARTTCLWDRLPALGSLLRHDRPERSRVRTHLGPRLVPAGTRERFQAGHKLAGSSHAEEGRPMSTLTTSREWSRIPRHPDDDYTVEAVRDRQGFLRDRTGVDLSHVERYSFDP